jgi:hypothetical protein
MSIPTSAQKDSMVTKKNPASQAARSGEYPNLRILPAVCVQKFQVMVIINQAQLSI